MAIDEEELCGQGKGAHLRYKFPELETQLKLLYTAITRSERSLYLIETKRSAAGAAFFGHIKERGLAQSQELLSSADAALLTHDEWVSRGLDFAIASKDAAHIDDEMAWLRRATMCFESADNAEMKRRARAHLQSVLLRKQLRERGERHEAVEVEVEVEAMRAVRGCVASNMLREAMELCQELLPHLALRSQQLLTCEVLQALAQRLEH